MHLLIDLQPLQTRGAANRGVGKVTNGMLRALASAHDVIGLKRHVPYLVQPAVEVPTLEVRPGGSTNELEEVIAGYHFDAVLNCSRNSQFLDRLEIINPCRFGSAEDGIQGFSRHRRLAAQAHGIGK